MSLVSSLDPGGFSSINPITEGCHAAWSTSFEIGSRLYNLVFEANDASGADYAPFCQEQNVACEEMYIVKFDHAFNVNIEDSFKRLSIEHRMSAADMLRLNCYLVGGVKRFLKELDPILIVGVPNDAKLAKWYARLSKRFVSDNRLIGMKDSAYHPHRVLVIHRND